MQGRSLHLELTIQQRNIDIPKEYDRFCEPEDERSYQSHLSNLTDCHIFGLDLASRLESWILSYTSEAFRTTIKNTGCLTND